MPNSATTESYRAYARTDKGRAAREAARARYREKQRAQRNQQGTGYNPAPLAQAIAPWRQQ